MKLSELATASGKGGYSQLYNDLVIDVGFNVRSSEQGLENAKVIYDVAADRKSSFSGVDLDTEAARLLEQQQAYQALAKLTPTLTLTLTPTLSPTLKNDPQSYL